MGSDLWLNSGKGITFYIVNWGRGGHIKLNKEKNRNNKINKEIFFLLNINMPLFFFKNIWYSFLEYSFSQTIFFESSAIQKKCISLPLNALFNVSTLVNDIDFFSMPEHLFWDNAWTFIIMLSSKRNICFLWAAEKTCDVKFKLEFKWLLSPNLFSKSVFILLHSTALNGWCNSNDSKHW